MHIIDILWEPMSAYALIYIVDYLKLNRERLFHAGTHWTPGLSEKSIRPRLLNIDAGAGTDPVHMARDPIGRPEYCY